ncbi:MAG TPA: NUDIX domain-containing protein [Conexivisphaerales archaeon]|nr:NUDIX domain-containing protein [Conexivisphaerales archaeon]
MSRGARDCVSGIMLARRRFLVEKRLATDSADAGLIAIPGGHVEGGESLFEALSREMKEELGVDVKKARLVGKEGYVASDGERQRIHYFLIEEWDGTPAAHEAFSVYWEIDTGRLVDPDRAVVERILQD